MSADAFIAAGPRPPRAGAVATTATYAWRGLLKVRHVPEQLIDVTIGPILLLVMFTYVFGGAISGTTGDYLQFLLPGILVMGVLLTSVASGVILQADRAAGVVDRFRSLPSWRAAPLVGAVVADSVRYLATAAVILVTGLLLGFDAGGGLLGVLAAALLVTVFAFALSWLFTTLGLVVRGASAVQGIGMMAIFLLVFVSNVFVDPATLPAAVAAFVDVNPVSHLVTAVRTLLAGDPAGADVALALAEAAAVTAVFAPLTARLYGRP
ncbi:ABC transporter permease [Jiangella mangrovi]|uniref:Transport permease protein n=1 Tax=Jiangella mangrovi TaxID=1524084 RepID=A0A7W9GUT1_9ACTN|nr:ABC transporter permease [Jiangella mangrovi]MBB5790178.1 ABC-2 type transport system permease protein [Jiangella mangrovi]